MKQYFNPYSPVIAARLLLGRYFRFNGDFYQFVARFIASKAGTDEIVQHVEVASLHAAGGDLLPQIKKQLDQAARAWGLSRRKGFDTSHQFDSEGLTEEQEHLLSRIENLYCGGLTAKETCAALGIEHSNKIAKLLCAAFPKNMGKGGARKGAGRKSNTI